MLVTYKAYLGQTGLATTATGKGLVKSKCWSITILLPSPLLIAGPSILKEGGSLPDCAPPGHSVGSEHVPLGVVDATSCWWLFQWILEPPQGSPLSWWPVASSRYSMIFGRQLSSILKMFPALDSFILMSRASKLEILFTVSRTLTLVTKSLWWMFRMVWSQCWWRCSRRHIWQRVRDQGLYKRIVNTIAL